MFKQQKLGLKLQHQTFTHLTARTITTHNLIINENHLRQQARKDILNLYAYKDSLLGVVKMNREHRYNTLTPHMIVDIERGVDTMDNDHLCQAIYLGTDKVEHWSNGTDFRTIIHMKKEDDYGRIQAYIQQIYNLQTKIASINKPLIAVAPGHAMNSGAALLASTSHPMATLTSKISFNEVTFGFVPHSGSTFHMSRMPGEFGTFMALTGLNINGSDAVRVDIARGVVSDPLHFSQNVSDVVSSLPFPEFGGRQFLPQNYVREATVWQKHLVEKVTGKDKFHMKDIIKNAKGQKIIDTLDEYYRLEERVPSSVAEAEFNYMKLLRRDAKGHEGKELGYLDFAEGMANSGDHFVYKNYFKDMLAYIKEHINQPYPSNNGVYISHSQLIDRCFYSNSVEEIMENLKKETDPFAAKCLAAMQRNSPTSMQLALRMLRQAINYDYKGCLQMELNVAFNRIQDSEFDLGVKSIIMSPKPKGSTFKQTPQWQPFQKQQSLDRYFEENPWSKGVNLQIVENALLPTKIYYERYTDQVRLWLNQTSATQIKIRENFDNEAKEALQEQGIDVRDKALTPEIARNHLWAKLAQEHVAQVQEERMTQLMTDQKLRDNYYQQIEGELEKLDQDDSYFYNLVNKNVSSVFTDAYFERLENVFNKSQNAHHLEKRRMLVRLKKFLFKSRILTYGQEENKRDVERLNALPFQQIHLTEQWDKSFRDMKHPDLWKTPLYYLSSAIGRVSLTTPELTKAYLTQPENRQQMTMFTLDKSELEKLQADVLENPQKYEMILSGNTLPDIDLTKGHKLSRDLGDYKLEERIYWFRLINDGRCPIDSLPFAQEFKAYKEWVDLIESNAIGTLRLAISKMLLDIQKVEGDPYSGKLNKLIATVNKTYVPTAEKEIKTSKMGAESRPLTEIRQSIRQMLKNNAYLGHLFDQNAPKNNRIIALKDQMESELLRLVEIVLLDKKLVNVDSEQKVLLEQRLASLQNPQQPISLQLNMIDQYLNRQNGEALVKDAFDLVAPFFMQQMTTKLEKEAEFLLSSFDYDMFQQEIILYYYFNKQFPDAKKHQALQRYLRFSFDKYSNDVAIARFPFLSVQFQRREMRAMLGTSDVVPRKTLEEMKYDQLEQAQSDLNMLQEFEENAARIEYKLATEEERENHYQFTELEQRELTQLQKQLFDIHEWLVHNKYEIDHHLTKFDQLKMCADSVVNMDLDMTALTESGDKNHWSEIAIYSKFVTDLALGLEKATEFKTFDAISFIETLDTTESDGGLFYAEAVYQRNFQRDLRKTQFVADRHNIIKEQISDFNQMQKKFESERQADEKLKALIYKKSNKIQLADFLATQNFVDVGLMTKYVQTDDYRFLKQPELVVDMAKVVKKIKSTPDYGLLDSQTDVVSLHHLKNAILENPELNTELKTALVNIVNYVCDQTKYISNAQRKNLSIKDYLEKYFHGESDAYSLFSSDLLKSKIESLLGKKESATPDIIDWQLGPVRTMPYDQLLTTVNFKVDNEDNEDDQDDEESEPSDILTDAQIQELIKKKKMEQNHMEQREDHKLSESDPEDFIDDDNDENDDYDDDVSDPECDIIVGKEVNPVTGQTEIFDNREYENQRVYRQARELAELTHQMTPTKNLYEHKLLLLMMEPEQDDERINQVVEEYTQIRLKGCMLNKDFAYQMRQENAHLYLKILREQVVTELGLSTKGRVSDLAYENIVDEFKNQQFFDLENLYNMQSVNNADAMGYDRLIERAKAETPEQNFDIAHETVFDKLLSDYFLDKRGEYKDSNKLLKDLSKIFEDKTVASFGLTGLPHLQMTQLKQNVEKGSEPKIMPQSFREMIQLDVAASHALQDSKNGLSESLRSLSIKQTEHPDFLKTQVPEYFEIFDVRKPAETYILDKLQGVIQECFKMRFDLEKTMTRQELMAFDKVLARYLQKDKLMPRLKHAVEQDYNLLNQGKAMVHQDKLNEKNNEAQGMKHENKQRGLNKKIVNEDAYYKLLAYSSVIDRDNAENEQKKEIIDIENVSTGFKDFYRRELKKEMQRPPREINPNNYVARKPWDKPIGEKFKKRREREADLFADHGIYMEKKLEQQDRIQLYYILEQLHESARHKPDPNSVAQEQIKEYFADPNNTYFFDKNKIV